MSPPDRYRVGPGSLKEARYLPPPGPPDLVSQVEGVSSDHSRPEGEQPGLQPRFQCVGPGFLSQPHPCTRACQDTLNLDRP